MKAVNLIPVEERRGGSGLSGGRSGGAVFAIFGLVAGLAILALLYGTASHQISNSKTEVASLQARTAQAQARASALSPYTNFVAMREQRQQAVQQLVDSRFDWAKAFHELGRVLPANVSLTSLSGTIGSSSASSGSSSSTSAAAKAGAATGAASVSSATPPGSVPIFTLSGCTTSQASVAIVLDRLRLIDGVQEVTLQSSTKAGASGSGGGGGGGTSGSCEGGDAAFNLTVTFQALPTVPTSGSPASTTVAVATSTTGAGSGAPR